MVKRDESFSQQKQHETHLFGENEAARRLGLSVATMRRRRLFRLPPAWVKLGGRVLYRSLDLDAFVEENVVQVNAARNCHRSEDSRPTGDGHQAKGR
jgi:hypothetical protein